MRPHHANEVRDLVEAAGAQLIFLPPYSPDLNPIEPCWSLVKHCLRSLKARVPEQLKVAIVRAFRRVTSRHLAGWFSHCGYHFK